jgi:adenosylcobinamide-GDP ribazoletransferase
VALGIQLSGGLHHDGLIDTADGLGAPEERRLEAMEDSRVGASGVLALVMVVLLQVAALIQLGPQAPIGLCLAAFWARVSPLWAMARFDYLRADGTAAFHRDHARPLWDALPTLLVVALLAGVVALVPLLLGMVVAILVAQALGRHLGGHTGDSYGAVLVLTEMITLLGLALLLPAS